MKKNNCGNCKFWKEKKSERSMGYCRDSLQEIKPIKKNKHGVIIRGNLIGITEILFGKFFGCINFIKK